MPRVPRYVTVYDSAIFLDGTELPWMAGVQHMGNGFIQLVLPVEGPIIDKRNPE